MNYTPQPLMAPMIGLIIAVIYGLSTDYEVFLVSRMVEAREQGMSTTEAIRIGTATTGRLITAAALVLAVVAGAFVFSDLVMMKYLAFGLLIALLLDATIVRMFLVPAVMKLLGDDCWWAPKWMKRLQHKIGLGETTLPDERKRPGFGQPENVLVGAGTAVTTPGYVSTPRIPVAEPAAAPTAPVSAPVAPPSSRDEAPTTRFAVRRDDRDIGSWLGELRRKTVNRGAAVDPADDATTAIPVATATTEAVVTERISAEQTRAIPVSRPETAVEAEVATEQLNARGKTGGGGVSAADLLRREGRL
jgi:RND superfamily putative drug exporter